MFDTITLMNSGQTVTVVQERADAKFTRQLVKGRIAETIFAQMLRSTGKFTVIEFGYEKIFPGLLDYQDDNALAPLRTSPDFAVIDRAAGNVHLVEVKFRKVLDPADILQCAQEMHAIWNPSYLFLATLEDFYLDEVNNIIAKQGEMLPLTEDYIPLDTQEQFIRILQDFESNH
jgi:hypothetical protein